MNAETPITEAEIASIVERFYAKVRVDPEIGPVFNDAVQKLGCPFVSAERLLVYGVLTTGRYKGNPLLAHFPLPIEERYFARWLKLFSETANEVMQPRRLRSLCAKRTLSR